MPRPPSVPSYRRHKASGQAVVTLPDRASGRRRDVLLGPFGSPESRAEYNRVVGEWLAAGGAAPPARTGPAAGGPGDRTVNELILLYLPHVETYYRRADGSPTCEVANVKLALGRLRRLYGHARAADFDGLALESLRNSMVAEGLARTRINRDLPRVRRMFGWAVAKKLVPAAGFHSLLAVRGLKEGRSAAKETDAVRPVAAAVVEATLPHLTPQVAAMVRLQQYTGCRPGEAVAVTTGDIDRSGGVWVYRPGQHKGRHRGHGRAIPLGPKAQELLTPWLRADPAEPLFQPREARAWSDARRRAARKSKVTPSQAARRPKKNPIRVPGVRYRVSAYDAAVAAGVKKANRAAREAERAAGREVPDDYTVVEHWHPHRIRHAVGTEVRKTYGLDAARALLGHRSPAVTETYAELDAGTAGRVAGEIG